MNKICFIICWIGKLPEYFPIWLKTCESNNNFDFLMITDEKYSHTVPNNVKMIPFTLGRFINRVKERIIKDPSIKSSYRLCDFRPMYGVIFQEELVEYDYWGYCDIDVVFGNIEKFLPRSDIYKYDAVLNGGHFSLIRNNKRMNLLFKEKGAIFDYAIVARKDAIFAFDETTGLYRIIREQRIKAKFGIPYIDADSKYKQLRSRMDVINPDHQAYYWEKGDLFRVKCENDIVYFQEIAYIHLQKRTLNISGKIDEDAFWITPSGFTQKNYYGLPNLCDIEAYNPYEGETELNKQAKEYKKRKINQILKRNPYQIYVRIKQQHAGINADDGTRAEMEWKENR